MLCGYATRHPQKVAWRQRYMDVGTMRHEAGMMRCAATAASAGKAATTGAAGIVAAEQALHRAAHCGVAGGMQHDGHGRDGRRRERATLKP